MSRSLFVHASLPKVEDRRGGGRMWNEGAVQKAEGNQTYAAEVKEPPPHASRRHWQQRRDYVAGDHLFCSILPDSGGFQAKPAPDSRN
jgi:hypothetical protein